MDVIRPVEVTESNLDSSTVPLDDAPLWDDTTTYATDDEVISGMTVWKSTVDDNLDSEPSDTNTDWSRQGYANRWRMFREGSDSLTSADGGFTVEVSPNQAVNGIALLNCEGLEVTVTMTDPIEGVVYERTESVTDIGAANWWEFYFSPYSTNSNFVFLGLPPYAAATIEVQVVTAVPSDPSSMGRFSVGVSQDLGITNHDTSVRRRTFSVRERDAFGNLRVVSRRQVPLIDYRVSVDSTAVDDVIKRLDNLQDQAAVFVGDATDQYGSTNVFGYYRDYEMTISTPTLSELTIEVVGY